VQLVNSLNYLYELPIGGTAVGTGINTPKNYASTIAKHLSNFYKLPFKTMDDKCCGLAFKERVGSMHGQIKNLASSLYKIANDIRFLSSGPRCGLNELIIPENEPGSSIMPGKVNPTQCEATMMACAEVIGNDVTVGFACSQGNFQLNVMMPVIAFKCVESINLLSDIINSLTLKCIKDIKANKDKINTYLSNSLMLVTALSPKIGYSKAAELAKYAHKNNLSLKEANRKLKFIDEKEFNQLMDAKKMVG
jgi:fumarate hydratase class II